MKKLLSIISIFLITIVSNAQELTGFMGIPFGSSKTEIKNIFLSKNPNAKIYTDDGKNLTFTNVKFAGRNTIGIIFGLDEKQKMHTAVVLLNNENEDGVFDLYDNLVSEINNKYHSRDLENEIWKYPYDKSDKLNHGTTAMKLGKCILQSMWYFDVNDPSSHDDDNVIVIENTQTCNLKISYQNGLMIRNVVSKNQEENSKDY